MKTLFIICLCSVVLAIGAFAQDSTITPFASPGGPSATAGASVSPSVAASPLASATAASSSLADRIHNKVDKKLKHKGINFHVGDDDKNGESDDHSSSSNDIPPLVIPLVGIVMIAVFGAPVAIVAVILYFGFSRNRMMHRTVRMMVEKGQPVPAALLNPPPAVRKRSDMRRGVVLVMVGLGLMVFLAAVNEGEGGAWAVGVIPFLIGAGYLLVWRLEGKGEIEAKTDNPPSLP